MAQRRNWPRDFEDVIIYRNEEVIIYRSEKVIEMRGGEMRVIIRMPTAAAMKKSLNLYENISSTLTLLRSTSAR